MFLKFAVHFSFTIYMIFRVNIYNYKKLNVILSLSTSISYFILFLLNFFLREKIKKEYNIEGEYDSCASTVCSTCGLAQEYREIDSPPLHDVYMNV